MARDRQTPVDREVELIGRRTYVICGQLASFQGWKPHGPGGRAWFMLADGTVATIPARVLQVWQDSGRLTPHVDQSGAPWQELEAQEKRSGGA